MQQVGIIDKGNEGSGMNNGKRMKKWQTIVFPGWDASLQLLFLIDITVYFIYLQNASKKWLGMCANVSWVKSICTYCNGIDKTLEWPRKFSRYFQ